MDIPRIPEFNPAPNNRSITQIEIFRQLIQLGTIEARVAAVSRGQAILLTQLGQISTSNALDLKSGDVIRVRASGSEQNPILKVSPGGVNKSVILEAAKHPALAKQIPASKPVSAILLGQQANGTGIKVGSQIFTIPRQADIKPGQLISLAKIDSNNTIEIKVVDHRQVLKSAIGRLLPQLSTSRDISGLTQLLKLVQSLSGSLSVAGKQAALPVPVKTSIPTSQFGLPTSAKSPATPTQSGISQQHAPASTNNLLHNLLTSIPTLSKLDKATLEHWVDRLLTSESTQQPNRLSTQQILQQIPKTEASLMQLLQKITQQVTNQQNGTNPVSTAEAKPTFEEPLQLIARDIIKLVEQSSNQQLLQQTSLRYQQELQQPLVLNLAIPVNEEQKTRELCLKIRQKHKGNEILKQCWDIHFDFEFGLLGLISTHLVLDENTLSASFWSELTDTQNKIDNGLDDFRRQLNRAGFELGQFYSFVGKPPLEDDDAIVPSSESLLDIKV